MTLRNAEIVCEMCVYLLVVFRLFFFVTVVLHELIFKTGETILQLLDKQHATKQSIL